MILLIAATYVIYLFNYTHTNSLSHCIWQWTDTPRRTNQEVQWGKTKSKFLPTTSGRCLLHSWSVCSQFVFTLVKRNQVYFCFQFFARTCCAAVLPLLLGRYHWKLILADFKLSSEMKINSQQGFLVWQVSFLFLWLVGNSKSVKQFPAIY